MDITLDGPRHHRNRQRGEGHRTTRKAIRCRRRSLTSSHSVGRARTFGYFGLQNHSDNDIVFFKEVAIKPLKK